MKFLQSVCETVEWEMQYSMMCLAAFTVTSSPLGSIIFFSSISPFVISSSSLKGDVDKRKERPSHQFWRSRGRTATAPWWRAVVRPAVQNGGEDHSKSRITHLLFKLGAALLAVWPRSNFIPDREEVIHEIRWGFAFRSVNASIQDFECCLTGGTSKRDVFLDT